MTKGRRLWIMPTIAALLSLPCGASVFGEPIPPQPITLASLQDVFEREVAIYADAGLRERETGTAAMGDSLELTLEGGQCIGVVTASAAPWPAQAMIMIGDQAVTIGNRAHVSSAAWCEPFATRMKVVFDADWQAYLDPSAQSRAGTVHYRVFTGRTDDFDLRTLPRGIPDGERRQETLVRMQADRASRAESVGLPDSPLLGPIRALREHGALLLPHSPSTWDSYRAAIVRYTAHELDTVSPRVHPATGNSSVATVEALIADATEHWRVLAVVDPNDFPIDDEDQRDRVPCATIRFGRLGAGDQPVSRFDLRTREPLPIEGVASTDFFCPGDPVRLYVVPAYDANEYVIRLFAREGQSAPRRPGDALEAPTYPPFVEAVEACRSRGEQCAEAAREARDGAHVPVDEVLAKDLFRRACVADSHECVEYAEYLLTFDEDEAAARLLTRACEQNWWRGCGRLGDLLRLGRGIEADYPAAHAAYRKACDHDVSAACANADAMELLNLASPMGSAESDSDAHAEDAPGVAADE